MTAPAMSTASTRVRRGRLRSAAALVRALWQINLVEELQYRGNFVASLIGTLFWMATSLLTLALFFRHTTRLGGWDFWEVVVLLGVFNMLTGVIEAVLRPGIGALVEQVRNGALDLVLVRPVDAQLYSSLRRLDVWRFTDVALGLGLTLYALVRVGRMPLPVQMLAFVAAMGSAVAVVYAIWVTIMSLAFWFVSVENLSVVFDSLYEAARYPVSAYPGVLRFVFTYLVPMAWTTTIPAAALTGRLSPAVAGLAVGVGVLALVLTRVLWRAALRRYTSAGG